MIDIVTVRFKQGGKQYYFNPGTLTVKTGDALVVSTARGQEYAMCTYGNHAVEETTLAAPLRPVVRIATKSDREAMEKNRLKEKEAFDYCRQRITFHHLDMKLVSVEFSFDGSKVLFFFTSENRVDFRSLVKDLAGELRARIELRQIGVRDEAKLLGGLGICGKPFCCHQFLEDFQPVSIKMAKTQSLSLNPTKISGTCGRLMCCLKYEQGAYEDAVRRCPKQESFVETPDGVGTVINVNLLREQMKVRLEESSEGPKIYRNCELRVVRNGKGRRPEDYVAPPLSQLATLRYIPDESDAPKTADAPQSTLSAALESIFAASDEPPRTATHVAGMGEMPFPPRRHQSRKPTGAKPGQKPAPSAGESRRPSQQPKKNPAPQKPRPPKTGEATPAPGEAQRMASKAKRPNNRPRHRPSKPKPPAQE